MRAHGITYEPISDPEEDTAAAAGQQLSNIRSNPSRRRRINSICGKCGKAFFSWRSFLQHSRCCSVAGGRDDEDGHKHLSRPPSTPSSYKDKRTRRDKTLNGSTPPPTHLLIDEEEAANCLVMLAASRAEPILLIADSEERSASVCKEDDDTAHLPQPRPQVPTLTPPISRGIFQCKDCKKVFSSHQALGGHRASHKKIKGCFAAHLEAEAPGIRNTIEEDKISNAINNHAESSSESITPLSIVLLPERPPHPLPKKKSSKVYVCSVCKQQFPSGQALGGHKRCHWMASNSIAAAAAAAIVKPTSAATPNLQIGCSSSGENLTQPHTRTLPQMFSSSNHESLNPNQLSPMDDLFKISLRFDSPAVIYLQPRDDEEKKIGMNSGTTTSNNDIEEENASNQNLDDDAESKEVNLAKLWDHNDMNVGEEKSTWLQVGTGYMADQHSRSHQS